jgi:hypothetical protein
MSSLQKIGNCYYIDQRIKVNGVWSHKRRKATAIEIEAHLKAVSQKERMDLCVVSCARPDCDELRIMTRQQKKDLKTIFPVRYNQFSDIYCSIPCREKHAEELKLIKTQTWEEV